MTESERTEFKNNLKQIVSEKLNEENIANDAEHGSIDIENEILGKELYHVSNFILIFQMIRIIIR